MTGRPQGPRLLLVPLMAVVAVLAACAMPQRPDTSGMSFSEAPLVGKVVWSDLVTEDLAAARRFYEGMFGWSFEESQGPGRRPYLLARSGGVFVAGLVSVEPRPDGVTLSRWLPYVSVRDVDAAAAKAVAGGGRIAAAPRDVPLGRVAAILDPEGAVIGLARSNIGDPDDATTAPGIGRRVWTELLSGDPQAAAAFYAAVVGYEARRIERRGGEYTKLASGGIDRAGILANPTGDWSPMWLTSFGVEDAGAAAARAASLGGRVLLDATPEVREGTMAVVTDPSGAVLVLQEVPKGEGR